MFCAATGAWCSFVAIQCRLVADLGYNMEQCTKRVNVAVVDAFNDQPKILEFNMQIIMRYAMRHGVLEGKNYVTKHFEKPSDMNHHLAGLHGFSLQTASYW